MKDTPCHFHLLGIFRTKRESHPLGLYLIPAVLILTLKAQQKLLLPQKATRRKASFSVW